MKLLLLKFKYFFSKPATKLFFKVFFISLPIVITLSYFVYPYITWMFETEYRNIERGQILEIMQVPRTTNNNLMLDQSFLIDSRNQTNTNDTQFWNGDALNYRYTEPQRGKPTR